MWGKTETVAPENVWANDKAVGMTRFDDGWVLHQASSLEAKLRNLRKSQWEM